MIEPGGNVRVRMVDGGSYGGVVVMMDELELVIQCTHDYVSPLDIDGVDEQIYAVLNGLSWKQKMVMAVDSGVTARVGRGFLFGGVQGLTTVLASAIVETMDKVPKANQSPVHKVIPREAILEISSLYDEAQQAQFDQWAE